MCTLFNVENYLICKFSDPRDLFKICILTHWVKCTSFVATLSSFTILLNWNSLTARKYKIGLIHCLLDRIWKICTNYDLVSIEIQKIKEILIKNDYPIHIVDLEILAFINKKYASDKKKLKDDNIKFVCLVLP